ncbi:MAG: hypothetical protein QGG58_11255 [Chloroflexota bacterium]|nr:hypothetical protein [Chloroflexota bacterium]
MRIGGWFRTRSLRRALAAPGIAVLLAVATATPALAHIGDPLGGGVQSSTLIALPFALLAVVGVLAAAAYFMYTAHRDRDLPIDETPTEPTV